MSAKAVLVGIMDNLIINNKMSYYHAFRSVISEVQYQIEGFAGILGDIKYLDNADIKKIRESYPCKEDIQALKADHDHNNQLLRTVSTNLMMRNKISAHQASDEVKQIIAGGKPNFSGNYIKALNSTTINHIDVAHALDPIQLNAVDAMVGGLDITAAVAFGRVTAIVDSELKKIPIKINSAQKLVKKVSAVLLPQGKSLDDVEKELKNLNEDSAGKYLISYKEYSQHYDAKIVAEIFTDSFIDNLNRSYNHSTISSVNMNRAMNNITFPDVNINSDFFTYKSIEPNCPRGIEFDNAISPSFALNALSHVNNNSPYYAGSVALLFVLGYLFKNPLMNIYQRSKNLFFKPTAVGKQNDDYDAGLAAEQSRKLILNSV